ncbi:glutamate receptor 4 [Elysia marginata]|uniref:Glutamate receptor 4 n=1 Tax=Elysia marginata TaxID=1093978 RepID=A0AAV4HGG4_9GAST|nr:glutamate receptor 4 [Elysia marginata]
MALQDPKSSVFIYTEELAKVNAELDKFVSCPKIEMKVVHWIVNALCDHQEIQKILMTSLDMESDIRSVVVASSYAHFIQMVLNIVATNVDFKWRRFLHATEWFVFTIDRPTNGSPILNEKNLPDFVTALSPHESHIELHQKSRIQPMKYILQIPFNKKILKPFQVNSKFSPSMNQSFLSQHLRKNAVTYLSSQKSVMAGMHIPTVVIESKPDRSAFHETDKKDLSWAGFNIDILNLLSEALGFSAEPFPVTDGGFYSVFKAEGKILGLTGYLVRKEAGLSPMGMINSARRRGVIDFIYPHITTGEFNIMYRVNFYQSLLGDPISELIDTREDLIFVLIGPCVAIAVGLVVFLVSGILLTKNKVYGCANLRRIYDFPLQWLFQTTEECPHQSGRILRASWGLFCVAAFAAYGALLTSNATAPTVYPKITRVKDLLSYPNFKIGNPLSNSHFTALMEKAPPGTPLASLWQVLSQQNSSDSSTFSEDKAHHVSRVLEGKYAFLTDTPIGLMPTLVDADYNNVRFAKLFERLNYISVPKNAFYKTDIERALLAATESGLIKHFFDKWFPPKAYIKKPKTKNNTKLHFTRIQFLLYIVAAGIGCAFLGLGAENILRLKAFYQRRL